MVHLANVHLVRYFNGTFYRNSSQNSLVAQSRHSKPFEGPHGQSPEKYGGKQQKEAGKTKRTYDSQALFVRKIFNVITDLCSVFLEAR